MGTDRQIREAAKVWLELSDGDADHSLLHKSAITLSDLVGIRGNPGPRRRAVVFGNRAVVADYNGFVFVCATA